MQNINKAENKNLEAGMKLFSKEVYFYDKLDELFCFEKDSIDDAHSVLMNLFQLCHHNLIFSFINLLRGHFVEPSIINRKSIEAISQATIINENLDLHSRIWCKGENKKDSNNSALFESIFRKDKFRSCKNKKELKHFYKLFSTLTHANITAGIHRFKKERNKIRFGYFDTEVDNLDAWMVRYLNYTILAYITILEEFAEIFNYISKDKVIALKNEHKVYMETKKSLLSQFGKYD